MMEGPIHAGQHNESEAVSNKSEASVPDSLEELSDVELIQTVEQLRQDNWLLAMENECFEKFLKRVDPSALDGLQSYLGE